MSHIFFTACKNGVLFIFNLHTWVFISRHQQELTSFYNSFDQHWVFEKCESTQTDSNYVRIFWIWLWKDWVWKVHGYNCIRKKQSFFSHYSNILQLCPSDCFLCCQGLHGVVQNENRLSEKDVLTLLPTCSL